MDNLIVVGCGEHFQSNVGPSLVSLERAGLAKAIATLDLQPRASGFPSADVPHIIRPRGQSLHSLLKPYAEKNPAIFLAHAHDCHASDSLDLLSHGFRVILEKPYALTASDLSLLSDALRDGPRRLALAQYYLMMQSSPLLHLAGLIRPDSFYLRESGFLERLDGKDTPLEDLVGVLGAIGRPRMLYVDLLEGEDTTGCLEHRGRQFADSRVGIGMILDLALHALAPVIALEGLFGSLPPSADVSVETAACDEYVRFANARYGVPPPFVPETYAEVALTTSLGIPVNVTVGKYVLRNENQRRLLIVGDSGQALLDMSNATLTFGRGDARPTALIRAPKSADTKYFSVIRACLLELAGESPYNFDASRVALQSNIFTAELHRRSCDQGLTRRQYPRSAAPGTILQLPGAFKVQARSAKASWDHEGAKLYFQHQFQRFAAIEDHAFKMSGGVFVITAGVLTFASRVSSDSFLSFWWFTIVLLSVANFVAVPYLWRVNLSIRGHKQRADATLRRTWPDLAKLDDEFPIPGERLQPRTLIIGALHVAVLIMSMWLLIRTYPSNAIPADLGKQQVNQGVTPAVPQKDLKQKP